MKITDIDLILQNYMDMNVGSSILIDGEWGCGKTTRVLDNLKHFAKTQEIYYMSLFGYDSLAAIVKALIYTEYRVNEKTVKQRKIGIHLVSDIAGFFGDRGRAFGKILEDTCDQVVSPENKELKKDITIIFDDLERVSKNIEYGDLLGFFDQLTKVLNCRLMCIVSEKNIADSERKAEFDRFKEKAFFRICKISENCQDIYADITKNHAFADICDKLSVKNLRDVNKAEKLFEEVKKNIEKQDWKLKKDLPDNNDLFKASLISVLCVLEEHQKASFSDDYRGKINEIHYQEWLSAFGKDIANGLAEYFCEDKSNQLMSQLNIQSEFVVAMLHYYVYLSLNNLKEFYIDHTEEVKEDKRDFFFLSDEDKAIQVEKLRKSIADSTILKEKDYGVERVIRYICEGVQTIPEKDLKKFAGILATEVAENSESVDSINEIIQENISTLKPDSKEKVESILFLQKEFSKVYPKELDGATLEALKSCSTDDFSKLESCVKKIFVSSESKEAFPLSLGYLQDNDFLIPNLWKTITYDEWSYVHFLGELSQKDKLVTNELLSIFNRQIESHPESLTLKSRVTYLINYYRIKKSDEAKSETKEY